MPLSAYRDALVAYIREQAQPPDKYSHQPRLYRLARQLGEEEGTPFDDDVLFAAAWMHDLGVFVGHRPEDPEALAAWDHLAYALKETPALLERFGFPVEKIPAVLEAIRTHMPAGEPATYEGILLRDADILEQLGAVGILRMVSKVGRDTRYVTHGAAVTVLRRSAETLPRRLRLDAARRRAASRLQLLQAFLDAADAETNGEL
jgi:uncharacterized protein